MVDLVSTTFNLKPHEALLPHAEEALREWEMFGNMELHSAWLYFGSIAAAAKALDMQPSAFRSALNRRDGLTSCLSLLELPDKDSEIILYGSYMLMEMADTERDTMFSATPLPVRGEDYARMVEAWREVETEQWGAEGYEKFPVVAARDLLEIYIYTRQFKKQAGEFFESADVKHYIQNALQFRVGIESLASTSKICAAAIEIIREYETYCRYLQAT